MLLASFGTHVCRRSKPLNKFLVLHASRFGLKQTVLLSCCILMSEASASRTRGIPRWMTQRIKLGSAVRPLPYHHPFQLAIEANACDHLTNGRYKFGIGFGFYAAHMERRGLDFSKARDMMHDPNGPRMIGGSAGAPRPRPPARGRRHDRSSRPCGGCERAPGSPRPVRAGRCRGELPSRTAAGCRPARRCAWASSGTEGA